MSELGPLRIGQNLTQFAWDGTDQYGDRLANGVYFLGLYQQLMAQILNIDHQISTNFSTKSSEKCSNEINIKVKGARRKVKVVHWA